MRGSIVFTAFGVLRTALALQHTASLRPRLQPMRMAVEDPPKSPMRMPAATPDTTQPLETTRRRALRRRRRVRVPAAPTSLRPETRHSWTRRPSRAAHESPRDRAFEGEPSERFARARRVFLPLADQVERRRTSEKRALRARHERRHARLRGWEEVRAFKPCVKSNAAILHAIDATRALEEVRQVQDRALLPRPKKTTTSWKSHRQRQPPVLWKQGEARARRRAERGLL